jgi:hypothetical protein
MAMHRPTTIKLEGPKKGGKIMNTKNSNSDLEPLIEAIDFNGWGVFSSEDGWEISQPSPAGEDFSFFVHADGEYTPRRLARGIQQAARDFDVDEHVGFWAEASLSGAKGVPSIRTLLHDAEDIQEMMDSLAEEVEGWC